MDSNSQTVTSAEALIKEYMDTYISKKAISLDEATSYLNETLNKIGMHLDNEEVDESLSLFSKEDLEKVQQSLEDLEDKESVA